MRSLRRILFLAIAALLSTCSSRSAFADTPPQHLDLAPLVQPGRHEVEHGIVLVHYLSVLISHVPLVTTLLALIGLDILMGLMAAFAAKKISSSISFKGMTKKAACVLIVGFAAVIEPLAQGIPLAKIVSLFYIFTESISILEAAGALGVPLPPQLMETLIKLRASEKVLLPAAASATPPAPAPVQITVRGPASIRGGTTQSITIPPSDDAMQRNTTAVQENTAARRAVRLNPQEPS